MNDSMAQADPGLTPGPTLDLVPGHAAGLGAVDVPGWKRAISWVCAILLATLFLASGLWKITDVQGWAVRMAQARVPDALGLPAAIFFGIAETVGAVMILMPRLRRWGAILLGLLLAAFLGYFAINYNTLRGADCSCFPWVKRVVGPGFFIGDGALLALALLAWLGARRSEGRRTVASIVCAVTLLAGVSFAVGEARQSGTKAPGSILVDGRPYPLEHGKVFLYYFDPQCMHCFDSAKRMAQLHWGDTRVVGVPISQARYAAQFIEDTGFHMAITSDHAKLKQVFPYAGVPAGVALENGREKAPLTKFDGDEPAATLKQLGLVY